MSKNRHAARHSLPSMALLAAGICLFAGPRALAAPTVLVPGSVVKLVNLNGDCQIQGSGNCETPTPLAGQFRMRVSSSAATGFPPSGARSFGLFDFTVDAPGLHAIDVVTGVSWSGFLTVTGDTVHTAAGVSLRLQILDLGLAGTPIVASQLIHEKTIRPDELLPGIPAGTKTETDSGTKAAQLVGIKIQGQKPYRVVLDVVSNAQTGAGGAGSDYRTGSNSVVFDYPTVTVPENLDLAVLGVVQRIADAVQILDNRANALSGHLAVVETEVLSALSRIDAHEASEAARFTELRDLVRRLTEGGADLASHVDLEVTGDLHQGFGIFASLAGEPARIDLTSVLFLEHRRGHESPAWVDVRHLAEVTDLGEGVYFVRLKLARAHLRRGVVQFGVRHEDGKRVGTAVVFAEGGARPRGHTLAEPAAAQ
jgi:hypothetical protein